MENLEGPVHTKLGTAEQARPLPELRSSGSRRMNHWYDIRTL